MKENMDPEEYGSKRPRTEKSTDRNESGTPMSTAHKKPGSQRYDSGTGILCFVYVLFSDTGNFVGPKGGRLSLKSTLEHKSIEIRYMKACKGITLTKNILFLSSIVIAMFMCISSNWENTSGSI